MTAVITPDKQRDLDALSDAQAQSLTAGVARGEEQAFERLYDLYHGRLARFTIAACRGDATLAQEVVQSTFLTAASKMKRLESQAHLWNWLTRVARQHLSKALRKTGQQNALALDENAPMDELVSGQISDNSLEGPLNHALSALEPEARLIVEMFYFENLSHKEIAERTGASPKAVSSRLERARARLREIVNEFLSHET